MPSHVRQATFPDAHPETDSIFTDVKIKVEYEAGLAGEPEPAVVWFGGRRLAVVAIVDRWYGPKCRWWKLETDGGVYILRCEDGSEEWELAAVPRT